MAPSQLGNDTAMILAAAATIGAATRPSGESRQQQSTRICTGIQAQLDAGAPGWTLSWLMMSPDNTNLAYIAQNQAAAQVVVAIRGTSANIADAMQDFEVGTVVPFPASGSATTVSVSKGAMAAFTEIVNTSAPGGEDLLAGNLNTALSTVLSGFTTSPTVFVVGHSLGGCVATMVAPYLLSFGGWPNQPGFGILTFAAPTAGARDFAAYFESLVGTSGSQTQAQFVQCTFTENVYDLIPQAWASFKNVLHDPYNTTNPGAPWYPEGTQIKGELKDFILALEQMPGNNKYAQPLAELPNSDKWWNRLNTGYELSDKALTANTFEDFMGQVGFQHANSTYLALINPDATLLTPPAVTAVNPNCGDGGMTIDILGRGFEAVGGYPVGVDFGTMPVPQESFTVVSDTRITVTNAPYCTGIVDVQVTNALGTSAASPASQFAANSPEPVRVAAISPTTAEIGEYVSVYGWGFTPAANAYFGRNQSPDVTYLLDPKYGTPYLYVKVPGELDPKRLDNKTVDVTIVAAGYSSPHSPADEFTYPASNTVG